MNKPAGCLINHPGGLEGSSGIVYDYIMAENGLFVQCSSPLLEARVQIAEAHIRGLAPMERLVELPKGKIPASFLELVLSVAFISPTKEVYMAVAWEGSYHLKVPNQARETASVQYDVMSNVVMDIHTHGALPPFFSPDDNADEQGFRLSMVIGNLLAEREEVMVRVGVYGYFAPVTMEEVFA